MSTILTVYGKTAFKRFLLPAINDADYSVLLPKDLYDLRREIALKLEVLNNDWRFVPSDSYDLVTNASGNSIFANGGNTIFTKGPVSLSTLMSANNAVLRLMVSNCNVASITIRVSDRCFSEYEHYSLVSLSKVSIGRNTDNDIALTGRNANLLSAHHAQLIRRQGEAGADQWCIEDRGSANGSFVNNRRIEAPTTLNFGDCIDLFGIRIIFLGNEIALNCLESGAYVRSGVLTRATLAAQPLAHINRRSLDRVFHRSPRQLSRLECDTVRIDDAPPPKEEVQHISILLAVGNGLAMALPMLLGCAFMVYASMVQGMGRGLFMYVGVITAVTSAVVGVVRTISSMRKAQEEYEAYEAMRHEKYSAYLIEREQEVRNRYQHNTDVLRKRSLPASVVCRYTEDSPELWSKNISQADFLTHRIGMGDIPFQVTVDVPVHRFTLTENDLAEGPQEIKDRYSLLKDVPICIDLTEHPLVGIVGGRRLEGAVVVTRTLITQIAATNSYTEVKIIVVYDEERFGSEDLWSYARWLPHVWNETRTFRYVASGAEEASEVFFELNRIMQTRMEHAGDAAAYDATPLPYYVMILAAPHLMEDQLMARYALSAPHSCGLTTIYLAERYEELPNECEFVISNDGSFAGMYRVTDNLDERVVVHFDQISLDEARMQATNLSRVRVSEMRSSGDVPQLVTFFDLYGIQDPEQLNVLTRWRKNRTYESMRAIVGQRAGGAPCYLDLHEKYHGPHGLVAGTTGSGKSETLQTLILSLACGYSPDDVSFFIIDYKGGGMANLLADLPHLVGQISNLSGNQVNRALVSIQSEKNRRETIFKEFGVKDIRDYTKLVKSGEAKVPVPHLIIVIDEFAEMKHDEPEFIQEIVSLSRVGRSLGIHLIMATQRPAGAVSEDIWANSRFKLCLRVQSKQDSVDMLHRPDAAYLMQSGRCYLQVGNDELFELFQSGYSGAPYVAGVPDEGHSIATMLSVNGTPSLVGSHARVERQRQYKRSWIQMLLANVHASGVYDPLRLRGCSHETLEQMADQVYQRLWDQRIDYPKSESNREALVALLVQIGLHGYDIEAIISADDDPATRVRLPQPPERTQLDAVVAHLRTVAHSNGYTRDYRLFLPLLPTSLSLAQLPGLSGVVGKHVGFNGHTWKGERSIASLTVGLGLYDDPLNQRQDSFAYDPLRDGNLAVFGGPQTGKSTLLQTLVYALACRYDPDELWFYVVEYSARKFSSFDGLPHLGGIVRDGDGADRLDKLFMLLSRMLTKRKAQLGDISFSQYLRVHGMGSLPAVMLVVDNYASLAQRIDDRYLSILRSLTKEGLGYGIFVAVSAGGVGMAELPSTLAQNFRCVMCLELPNAFDYATYLRQTRLRLQPETGVPGRALVLVGDRPLELQVATVSADADESKMGTYVQRAVASMARAWTGHSADPIPSIPEQPTWESFYALDGVREMLVQSPLLPVGYDARTADPFGIDLEQTYTYCLTGARKKGKTNALRLVARSAKAKGSRVVLVDYASESKSFAQELDIEFIPDEREFSAFIEQLMPQIVERNKRKYQLVQSGLSPHEVYQEMLVFERIVICIENLPQFVERAYQPQVKPDKTFDNYLETVLDRCAQHNIYWFATADKAELGSAPTRSLYRLFVHDQKGMHFGGKVYSTALPGFSFDNHNRRTADDARPAGHAMLPVENESPVLEVVVPLERGTSR